MEIINVFFESINLISGIFILIGILVGVLAGLVFKPKAGNRVLKIIPSDKRYVEFDIDREYAFSIDCKNKKGYPPQRFLKTRGGLTGTVGRYLKKACTLFFGLEGTAYTQAIEDEDLKLKKSVKPTALNPFSETLKTIVGKVFYNQIPDNKRAQIEQAKVNVTVKIKEEYTPELRDKDGKIVTKTLSEENIKTEEDKKASKTFWEGVEQAQRGKWIEYIFVAGFGFGIAVTLQVLGVLTIG